MDAGCRGNKGRFPFNKNSGLKFRKFRVLNGTVHCGCTDPTQATARFVMVASQHTHNYALKVKSRYCLYPKEHSTVEKGWWKTKGRGILFPVESIWMQVKVKNSCELKRSVSQNIRTIRSNSWNCTVNKFGVLGNLYSTRLCCIHFTLIDKLLWLNIVDRFQTNNTLILTDFNTIVAWLRTLFFTYVSCCVSYLTLLMANIKNRKKLQLIQTIWDVMLYSQHFTFH